MTCILIYYCFEVFRTFLFILQIYKVRIAGIVYLIFALNELFLLAIAITLISVRLSYQGKYCSGEYPLFSFETLLVDRGMYLKYMIYVLWGYSIGFCWLLHLLLTFCAVKLSNKQ